MIRDGLDDCIKAIDEAARLFGANWQKMDPKHKREWIESFAKKNAHPMPDEAMAGVLNVVKRRVVFNAGVEVMKIYISGGVTNCPGYMEKFNAAERKLKALGHIVINPAKVNGELPAETSYKEYMKMSECMLDMADAIFMLDGWEKSTGARYEKHYAEIMGKKVIS